MENKAIEVGILSCGSEISERFMKNCNNFLWSTGNSTQHSNGLYGKRI